MKNLIGKKITDGKIQSFYLRGKIHNKINCTFLKFDKWIKIVISDGILTVEEDNQRQNEGCLSNFYYPIIDIIKYYPEFEKYIGKEIIAYNELVSKNNSNWVCGISIQFEDNLTFIIYETFDEKNEFVFENKVPKGLVKNKN